MAKKFHYLLPSVEENVRAIVTTINVLRTISPSATIVIQISPTPLFGAVGGDPAINQDFLSKAMLRISINEVINNWNLKNVIYWPTIEIFRWISSHNTEFYGGDDGSAWHVSLEKTNQMLAGLMGLFKTNRK